VTARVVSFAAAVFAGRGAPLRRPAAVSESAGDRGLVRAAAPAIGGARTGSRSIEGRRAYRTYREHFSRVKRPARC